MRDVIKSAIEKGLCKPWKEKMHRATMSEYCQMFFDGSDWAMENDFPSLGLLRKYNTSSVYGLYTDAKCIKNNIKQIAFFGDSEAVLIYDKHSIGEIYVRHRSYIKITAKDNSILYVTVADNAQVDIQVDGNAIVNVYRYGGRITGNVTVNERSWKK